MLSQHISPNPPITVRQGRMAVVVGAGRSGRAAVRLLHQLGLPVRLVDRKAVPQDFAAWAQGAGVEIICKEHDMAHFADADVVVPSPGVAIAKLEPFFTTNPTILAETELACRFITTEKVIGITGTSGKTTTTSLCDAMLRQAGLTVFTGGNIGTPLSEYVLDRLDGKGAVDVVVLELSSFQLQTCHTLRPHVAMLLNITENHLDYHANMEEYIEAKRRLFQCQCAEDVAILGPDLQQIGTKLTAQTQYITRQNAFLDTKLLGPHNQFNAEAAYLACKVFGVDEGTAKAAVATFTPIEHRLEHVATKHGITYVNDSKATTAASLTVALQAFTSPILLLAGGTFKGGDLAALIPLLKEKVKAVGLFGASREAFESAWQGAVPLYYDTSLEEAMLRLNAMAHEGDVLLLAPATSSFDQYANYTVRGHDFKRVVHEVLP